MMNEYDVIIVGAGAAGFFAAINTAETNPKLNVTILERGKEGLQKVKISGGGRCNVTHAEFVPSELVPNYPRGEKELLGPFHQFMTGDTMSWFEERGVPLKIEEDGRVFPESNSSQTIVDCFLNEADKGGISVHYNHSVKSITYNNLTWQLNTNHGSFLAQKLLIATGSNPKIWAILEHLGHTIIPPVPSLFTFNVNDKRIRHIPGVVVKHVTIQVVNSTLISDGPLLITHVGFSAPAILKLSAFGAIELAQRNYKFEIQINFVGLQYQECLDQLKALKQVKARKVVSKSAQFDLPKRLWYQLVIAAQIDDHTSWADINREQLELLSKQLTQAVFNVEGKSTFKEEFVTAGGIDLKEVNFKTFQSKLYENLYFAGEVLNIDAITGGFNFQNAWTGAYIAAQHIAN